MIEELEKEAENIFVEASVYLDDWNDGNYKFDSNQTTINHIKNTTKEDLVILMNENISSRTIYEHHCSN